jgi:hypothetical protein
MATIYGLVTNRDGVPHTVYSTDGEHTTATNTIDVFDGLQPRRVVPIATRASPPGKRARRWT